MPDPRSRQPHDNSPAGISCVGRATSKASCPWVGHRTRCTTRHISTEAVIRPSVGTSLALLLAGKLCRAATLVTLRHDIRRVKRVGPNTCARTVHCMSVAIDITIGLLQRWLSTRCRSSRCGNRFRSARCGCDSLATLSRQLRS